MNIPHRAFAPFPAVLSALLSACATEVPDTRLDAGSETTDRRGQGNDAGAARGSPSESATDASSPGRVEPPDAGGSRESCHIAGNVASEDVSLRDSVAFVIADEGVAFIARPGMRSTSISHIDSDCRHAYGWSRDGRFDDDAARESSWVLDLETLVFTPIEIPSASWVVVRNALDDGTVVGKLALDSGTPGDRSDDETRAFIHHVGTAQTELVTRDGYFDIGFTGINEAGTIVGFNDFGTLGFSYQDGVFTNLEHPDAYRLFPFDVRSDGTIVGFWGSDEDTWYDNAVNPSFVAEPNGSRYVVSQLVRPEFTGFGITGMNDRGEIAGIAYSSAASRPAAFRAAAIDAEPTLYPLLDGLEPFVTGISEAGVVYGEAFVASEPPICGGHGVLEDEMCSCDEGYELDPHDSLNCIAPDAACAGHGHLHGDECHCDTGFEPTDAGRTCAPVGAVDAGAALADGGTAHNDGGTGTEAEGAQGPFAELLSSIEALRVPLLVLDDAVHGSDLPSTADATFHELEASLSELITAADRLSVVAVRTEQRVLLVDDLSLGVGTSTAIALELRAHVADAEDADDIISLIDDLLAELGALQALIGEALVPIQEPSVAEWTGLSGPLNPTRLPGGNTLVASSFADEVVELDAQGEVVWRFDDVTYPTDAKRTSEGNTLIADRDGARVIEVDPSGVVTWEYPGVLNVYGVQALDSDRVLITIHGDYSPENPAELREVDRAGTTHWSLGGPDFPLLAPSCHRLENGNTVVGDNSDYERRRARVFELTSDGEVVWEFDDSIYGIYGVRRLRNGNTLINDQSQGRIIEVSEAGDVVWRYGGLSIPGGFDVLENTGLLISDFQTGRLFEIEPREPTALLKETRR